MMERELVENGVDVSGSGRVDMPSGQGVVLLQPGGAATSIVLWGANTAFAEVGGGVWGVGRGAWGRTTLGQGRTCLCLGWGAAVAVTAWQR